MSDLIDRAAAIDAVEHITSSMSVCVNTDECYGMKRMQRRAVIELTNLPSEQPKIIRCKDCKHHSHDAGYGYDWCNRMSGVFRVKPEDFCSRAERRTNDKR